MMKHRYSRNQALFRFLAVAHLRADCDLDPPGQRQELAAAVVMGPWEADQVGASL
jgi:hypothetical protein